MNDVSRLLMSGYCATYQCFLCTAECFKQSVACIACWMLSSVASLFMFLPGCAAGWSQANGLADGTSNHAALVGTGAQVVAKLLLGSFIGPFADPVGASVGVLAEKAWLLFAELLHKYKAIYRQGKAAAKRALAPEAGGGIEHSP